MLLEESAAEPRHSKSGLEAVPVPSQGDGYPSMARDRLPKNPSTLTMSRELLGVANAFWGDHRCLRLAGNGLLIALVTVAEMVRRRHFFQHHIYKR